MVVRYNDMIVLIMSKVPQQLRGYASRFLLEVNAGVFIGNCSKRVRESLWDEVENNMNSDSSSIMMWSDSTMEQGFNFISRGRNREYDLDGLMVIASKTQASGDAISKKGWSRASRYRRFAR